MLCKLARWGGVSARWTGGGMTLVQSDEGDESTIST